MPNATLAVNCPTVNVTESPAEIASDSLTLVESDVDRDVTVTIDAPLAVMFAEAVITELDDTTELPWFIFSEELVVVASAITVALDSLTLSTPTVDVEPTLTIEPDSLTRVESELELDVDVTTAVIFAVFAPTVNVAESPNTNPPESLTLTEYAVPEHSAVIIAEEGDTSAVEYFALLYFHWLYNISY